MKLNYGEILSGSQVLKKDSFRIELHLVRLDEALFALLMFSGQDAALPTKSKHQGPYHSKAQVQGALNAISCELEGHGYHTESIPLIWQIQAQTELKKMRAERLENATDTTFTPLGVLPEEISEDTPDKD